MTEVNELVADVKVIDSDTHWSEPHDLWTSLAPAKYRDLVPQIKEHKGRKHWVVNGDVPLAGDSAVSAIMPDGEKMLGLKFLKADIDMYVEYTGVGQTAILKAQPLADAALLYKAVKERYNQEMNLIWLKPFGFDAAHSLGVNLPAEAAPVVRKDTLKKFPALARLINKLGGKIDQKTIASLEKEAASGQPKQVAHGFLKNNRLI